MTLFDLDSGARTEGAAEESAEERDTFAEVERRGTCAEASAEGGAPADAASALRFSSNARRLAAMLCGRFRCADACRAALGVDAAGRRPVKAVIGAALKGTGGGTVRVPVRGTDAGAGMTP